VAPPPPTSAPAPATTRPPAPESEALFNDAIRAAVAEGNIDRALKLMEDAERFGSKTARQTFIDAVNRQGGQ
jgi:maltose operon protein